MVYPAAHNYFTVHWGNSGASGDEGQFGLRFDGPFPSAGAEITEAAKVATFWTTGTAAMPAQRLLKQVKIARIMPNGEYDPVVAPLVYNYSPVVAGAGPSEGIKPLQSAFVVTLLTGALSGLAHKGRIYLPAMSYAFDADGRWSLAQVNACCNALSAMLSDLDGGPLGQLTIFSKGNAAIPGGASRPVTGIQADNKPDVQRRRAAQQPSSKGTVYNVT